MTVADILSAERIGIAGSAEGVISNKQEALERLSLLLARGVSPARGGPGLAVAHDAASILRVLVERERSQSTGVGGGVAVPHGSLEGLDSQVGALLVCPEPVEFEALDGRPVTLVFGLLGPRGAPAVHLKTLARVSRTLRDEGLRERLRRARSSVEAFALLGGGVVK